MKNQSTSNVLKWIVDDVVAKMKPEFVQEGVDEGVLDELRQIWEAKLQQQGLLQDDTAAADDGASAGARPGTPVKPEADELEAAGTSAAEPSRKRKHPDSQADDDQPSTIPQQDGPADNGGEGGQDGEGAEAEPADDEQLSPDESGDEEEDEDVQDFLCAQFEKVNRTKNRWKINMKDGVFHINGKDYLFRKANGEWTF